MGLLDRLFGRKKKPKARPRPRPRAPKRPTWSVPAPDQDRALLLYKFDACPFCVRVMRHAEELGVDLDMKDTRAEDGVRDELREKTGGTQVPCLFIDGQPLLESADINRWLTEYSQRRPGSPA